MVDSSAGDFPSSPILHRKVEAHPIQSAAASVPLISPQPESTPAKEMTAPVHASTIVIESHAHSESNATAAADLIPQCGVTAATERRVAAESKNVGTPEAAIDISAPLKSPTTTTALEASASCVALTAINNITPNPSSIVVSVIPASATARNDSQCLSLPENNSDTINNSFTPACCSHSLDTQYADNNNTSTAMQSTEDTRSFVGRSDFFNLQEDSNTDGPLDLDSQGLTVMDPNQVIVAGCGSEERDFGKEIYQEQLTSRMPQCKKEEGVTAPERERRTYGNMDMHLIDTAEDDDDDDDDDDDVDGEDRGIDTEDEETFDDDSSQEVGEDARDVIGTAALAPPTVNEKELGHLEKNNSHNSPIDSYSNKKCSLLFDLGDGGSKESRGVEEGPGTYEQPHESTTSILLPCSSFAVSETGPVHATVSDAPSPVILRSDASGDTEPSSVAASVSSSTFSHPLSTTPASSALIGSFPSSSSPAPIITVTAAVSPSYSPLARTESHIVAIRSASVRSDRCRSALLPGEDLGDSDFVFVNPPSARRQL